MTGSPQRLTLVGPRDELAGHGPPAFERLARTAPVGSVEHRALLNLCFTLSQEAVRVTVPPSGRVQLTTALESLKSWSSQSPQALLGESLQRQARDHRAQAFAASPVIEELTALAIARAPRASTAPPTPLGDHADLTVARYFRLSAHHATAALCHSLDAVLDPASCLHVPGDVAGALAYQAAAVGSARHPAFQQAAIHQAEWEVSRCPAADPRGSGALSLLVFHEYLGARWRAHGDLQRERIWGFVAWALAGRSAGALD